MLKQWWMDWLRNPSLLDGELGMPSLKLDIIFISKSGSLSGMLGPLICLHIRWPNFSLNCNRSIDVDCNVLTSLSSDLLKLAVIDWRGGCA